MDVVLGIDVGGSTTKIVGYETRGRRVGMLQVEATDQLTSAYGAFGKFMSEYKLRMADIRQIVLTGVGAAYLNDGMYDIPTRRVNEFLAIGLGGLALAELDRAVIVSMGTGTALVRAEGRTITHLGGSGVGGGTLSNLCGRFAGASNFETITELAAQGDLSRVDLMLGDISKENIGSMPPHTTVSNFGNLKDTAVNADVVLGIINMIFESIGMMAVFATMNGSVKDVVLTGSLTVIPQAKYVFDTLQTLHPVRFHIPRDAIYATAVGAALSEIKNS
ncbi:MAG: pantothenate kinase [Clostridiales bacterium]|jgi:type II pantothenate kinase|nr:pantothenate kinase [Clostridiales bacterium]